MKPNKIQERLIEELVRSVQMIEQNNAPEEKKDRDLEHVKKEYLGKILYATLITEENIKETKFRFESIDEGVEEKRYYYLEDIELIFNSEGSLIEAKMNNEVFSVSIPIKYMFELESIIKDLYK